MASVAAAVRVGCSAAGCSGTSGNTELETTRTIELRTTRAYGVKEIFLFFCLQEQDDIEEMATSGGHRRAGATTDCRWKEGAVSVARVHLGLGLRLPVITDEVHQIAKAKIPQLFNLTRQSPSHQPLANRTDGSGRTRATAGGWKSPVVEDGKRKMPIFF
ncbi:hypothetical protein ROHU_008512 [Labeo rohita]|uniref:Uncharacterized protein n=1 Tax=Labeo rohita TaxID=84645 RepID=A0A498M5U4_LABRO|nr:hypothetical protein ROHU_033735 [Labeo rohita]RXN15951.1 hypothetical protein ROHU_008512 [Labeo rohita]